MQLCEDLGRPLLQKIDRRVVAENVVANLGCRHRGTHFI
jgi:hypothetical protein